MLSYWVEQKEVPVLWIRIGSLLPDKIKYLCFERINFKKAEKLCDYEPQKIFDFFCDFTSSGISECDIDSMFYSDGNMYYSKRTWGRVGVIIDLVVKDLEMYDPNEVLLSFGPFKVRKIDVMNSLSGGNQLHSESGVNIDVLGAKIDEVKLRFWYDDVEGMLVEVWNMDEELLGEMYSDVVDVAHSEIVEEYVDWRLGISKSVNYKYLFVYRDIYPRVVWDVYDDVVCVSVDSIGCSCELKDVLVMVELPRGWRHVRLLSVEE